MLATLADSSVQVRTRILVIEDDDTSREALVQILRLHDYHVISTSTLKGGIERIKDTPNVVLLDLMLPDGNGVEVLRIIREKRLPIQVAVITGAGTSMMQESMPLAPNRMFIKPIDIAKLVAWLRDLP